MPCAIRADQQQSRDSASPQCPLDLDSPDMQNAQPHAEEVTLPAVRLDRNLNKMGGVWN
jgi:hypothetical protein